MVVCPSDNTVTFELITGQVYNSPTDILDSYAGVMHLTDCLQYCLLNDTCKSVNFETGLCVLVSSSANQRPEALTSSQFPVFIIYAQKVCLKDKNKVCTHGWAFERVKGYELKRLAKKAVKVQSRVECMQLCLIEHDFECRSVNFDTDSHECAISDMDRHTINLNNELRSKKYGPSSTGTIDYMENSCIQEPKKLCDIRPINGKILKTVDSVYESVKTIDECKEKCMTSAYRCHSFDLGDPSHAVCRTSHLDKNSLSHIDNPYIEITGATTYELLSCYNVTILCRSREMIAKVRTTKVFDGKIYAKSKPNLCVNDISNSLEFEIKMKYNDVECDVKQEGKGQFTNDIVIQHHDMVVTTQDLMLNVHCKYDLSNKSISNNVNLAVDGDVDTSGHLSETVSSPNVTMRITDLYRSDIMSAQVGDSLLLRFSILEQNSPFELFVRELIAIDGQDMSEIVLIDSNGCPTDALIMGPMGKADGDGQVLEARFDAFKFPTSDLVQFKALVAPCLPSCEPIKCSISGVDGRTSEVHSYGKRRRRKRETDEVLVEQSLSVSDRFGFQRSQRKLDLNDENVSVVDSSMDEKIIEQNSCKNIFGISLIVLTFILAQTILVVTFACLWSAKRRDRVLTNREWPQSQLISNETPYPSICNDYLYQTTRKQHF
ncbi:uncharacterized protein LOC128960388 [Oppia nitens]|uniref:uncharacterized protein LOC128960388 n=1 Tax=Oppia nitens TaxID=1686743 RepID=UPI0023DC2F7D|nr:uncharacterized protein LOC128960388 [Oppia nitens]